MAASQYQRDHEYGGDGLEAVLESENVRRIRQAEGLGTGWLYVDIFNNSDMMDLLLNQHFTSF